MATSTFILQILSQQFLIGEVLLLGSRPYDSHVQATLDSYALISSREPFFASINIFHSKHHATPIGILLFWTLRLLKRESLRLLEGTNNSTNATEYICPLFATRCLTAASAAMTWTSAFSSDTRKLPFLLIFLSVASLPKHRRPPSGQDPGVPLHLPLARRHRLARARIAPQLWQPD